jgi:hypothetical protein
MKAERLIPLAVSLLLPTLATAQGMGTVYFSNRSLASGVDAQVTVCENGARYPAGAGYLATLYWGWTPDSLQPALVLSGGNFVYLAKSFAGETGYLNAGKQELVGTAEGAQVYMQMRAWEGGSGSTYESALVAGKLVGFSNVFPVRLGGDNQVPPLVPAPLVGLQAFSLVSLSCMPEPAPLLLVLCGLPLLLWWRHRSSAT